MKGAVLVIVPCRDEARTLARKLANFARLQWPDADRSHVIVVVDDHSTDDTRRVAEVVGAELFPRRARPESSTLVDLRVVANDGAPGKPNAIRRGLAERSNEHALVLLTDADVIAEEGALQALVDAFERDPGLALACGAQSFVADLAEDGTARSRALGPLVDARTAYDRWTARVRRFESKRGVLFSVHGQWLAWRAELGLAPDPALAADDLDLAFQVRAREHGPRALRLVERAVFHEVRPPKGAASRAQAVRRARAWFQVLAARPVVARSALESAQVAFYRHAPAMAPRLTFLVPLATIVAAGWFGGRVWGIVAGLVWLALATSGPGWRWIGLVRLIAEARDAERDGSIAASWETPRA